MQRYYSQQTGCTYLSSVHGDNMPADVVELDDSVFIEVIANPALGKVRSHDDDGLPILIDRPPATNDELAAQERSWRDGQLAEQVWLRDRHRDQLEINANTTLTGEQFTALLVHMQTLRDWPQSDDFPDESKRPSAPAFIYDFRGEP